MKQSKAHWGIYDMMSNDLVPMYFFFTPCICIAHYANSPQGAIYIGWLNYCLFIPYDSESTRQYYFYLLPLIGYRYLNNLMILSFSWLFWIIDFPFRKKD